MVYVDISQIANKEKIKKAVYIALHDDLHNSDIKQFIDENIDYCITMVLEKIDVDIESSTVVITLDDIVSAVIESLYQLKLAQEYYQNL